MSQVNIDRANLEDIKHRKNIRNYREEELSELREAFKEVYAITNRGDWRGFQHWAGKHGRPEGLCNHGREFLPWHRAYLYGFEKAIQRVNANVMLPYWDWASRATQETGIPDAFAHETLQNNDPNPLFSGPIVNVVNDAGNLQKRNTYRANRQTPTFEELARGVSRAMKAEDFRIFQRDINYPHGGLHIRVGGDMSAFDFAAYDPIFWAHHANVDRQWAQWQRQHSDATVPSLDHILQGVDMRVETSIDHRMSLGYDYIANECFELFPDSEIEPGLAVWNASQTQFAVSQLEDGFDEAILEFHNVEIPTNGTREIRVFVNLPDANDRTSVSSDHYAGSLILLGKLGCFGDVGHCDHPAPREKFDVRPGHHLKPEKHYLEITETMQNSDVANTYPDRTQVSFVILDAEENPVGNEALKMEGLSLVVRD